MRIAWFAPPDPLDDTASLLVELGSTHQVEAFDERRAHDFVWQHARQRFEVCVYELSDTPAARFLWPYLLQYPGIARLRAPLSRLTSPGGRDARIPLLASRLVVVADAALAGTLQERHPAARIRHAPLGVDAPTAASAAAEVSASARRAPEDPPVVGVVDASALEVVARAGARAREAGSRFEVRADSIERLVAGGCDLIVSFRWPPGPEPPLAALSAMAAARPAIVHEAGVTAHWPALDPQTWQPRGVIGSAEPIVVSIDPVDEEHSLMLAIRRLARDADLRTRLGAAAHAWWRAHATPAHAAAAWTPLLEEAATLAPPERPNDWPAHLTPDGTESARAILAEFGVSVDFLE